ncbi:MAG TPA: LysR family transcriptional regulator [Gaiellaceae bacterium]|jgi:DNA-binding transcriptional LysR family regulator|nr:LysR family transcriptional regulator [Gaiellaceae bacterium]
MDERRLKVFLAVVEEGSVTRAARKLRLAQPSVSQTLRAIELECGVELFHRLGRGLRITAAGEALVGPAREALRSLERVTSAADDAKHLLTGRLDVAALSTLASDPLAALLGRFRSTHAGVSVRVLEAESVPVLATSVRDGSCEVGLGHLPLRRGDLATVPLGEQQLVLVQPPGSPGAGRRLRLAALAATPLVVSPPGTGTRTLLDEAFASAGIEPSIAVETAAREATVPLVLAGAGTALLPASIAADARRRGAVVRRPEPAISRQIGLIHRHGRLSPAAAAFLREATR